MPSRHWLYLGGFVISGLLVIGAGLMSILEGLSALSGGVPASEEFILITMVVAAGEWIVIAGILAVIATMFLVATIVAVLRNASLPRDDRLVSVVEFLERKYPILRQFDVSETVAPTAEDRRRELKEKYVQGEISEAEFERQLEDLIDDTASGETSRSESGATIEVDNRSR